jgi:hypothetical protein
VPRLPRFPLFTAVLAILASATLLGATGTTATASAGPAASAGASASAAVPRYNHVFYLVEENHGFSQIIGNPAAPTINKLAKAYGYASQYYGVSHPSGPNYVAMLGGGTFGVGSDNPYWLFHVNQPSLMSQLDQAGLSWKGYFQGMPYAGYRGYCYPVRCLGVPDSDTLYIAKHNGMVYFHSVNSSAAELAKMQPLASLNTDLASGHVPNFSYIMPDECNDMHGAPPVCADSGNPGDVDDNYLVSTADAFLARTVSQITRSSVWTHGSNAIVIAFDEGASGDNSGCCGSKTGGGHALTVVVTNRGPQHLADPTPYNHYSLLSALQHAFGLGCLAATCDTANIKPMTPLFTVKPGAAAGTVPASLLQTTAGVPHVTGRGTAGSSAPTASTTPGKPAHGAWQAVPSPNLSSNDNNLAAVSAGGANNVWAVGDYYTQNNPNIFRNLALHWNGTTWTAMAPPNVGTQENTLFSVSALPSGQAWAAGYYANAQFKIRTLIEHWNGHSWSVVPTPDPAAGRDVLFAVSAVNDHDVWAVGGRQDSLNGRFATLIEHWDGHSWSVVPSPNPGPNGNELFGVTSHGPGAVWAVGQQQGSGYPGGALAERWDGHAWRVVSGPAQGGKTFDPYAAAVTGSQVVVAGSQENGQSPQRTMAFTAGGGPAAVSPTINVSPTENQFYAAASLGNTAWAAGWSADNQPNVQNHSTLIEKLSAGHWTVLPTPNPGVNNGLGGISAAPNGELWAVGSYKTSTSTNRTLIEHYVP